MSSKHIKFLNATYILTVSLGLISAYWRILEASTGFFLIALGLLIACISAGISMAFSISRRNLAELRSAAVTLPAIMLLVSLTITYWGEPLINDVTTNTDHPPKFLQRTDPQRDLNTPYTDEQKKTLVELYPDLNSRSYAWPCFRVFEEILKILRQNPKVKIVKQSENPYIIQYTQTTPVLKFTDDIVIGSTQNSIESQCLLDVRSRSRVGRSDLDANYNRIHNLFRLLDKALSKADPMRPATDL